MAALAGFAAGSIESLYPSSAHLSQVSAVITTTSVTIPSSISTQTVTQYLDPYNLPNNANTTNSTLGLSLALSVNSTVIHQFQTIKVSISIFNVLPRTNNVSGASDWKMNVSDNRALGLSCFAPANFVIFQGYYEESNLSTADTSTPLNIYDASSSTSQVFGICLTPHNYVFQPLSAVANVSSISVGSYELMNTTSSSSVLGICTMSQNSEGSCTTFLPNGIYTIVAYDEWGQIVLLHFVGTNSSTNSSVTKSISPTTALSIPCAIKYTVQLHPTLL